MAHPLPSARRGPVPPFFNRQGIVTKEEVEELKRQKLLLLEERKQLRTKIARMELQNKRGGVPSSRNRQLEVQLQRQQRALETLLAEQQEQLDELRASDRATLALELQEDTKVLLQERLRLEDLQVAQAAELEATQRALDELLESDGPEVLAKQKEKMQQLTDKIAVYRNANAKLHAKIRSLNQHKAAANEGEVAQRAEELQAQIRKVRDAIARLEQKYERADIEHAEFMARLRDAPLE
jgi:chromosome segregation ATPase